MTQGAKRYRGQIQVFEGSPTGEPVIVSRFDKDTCGSVKFIGEAKVCSSDNEHNFFIQKLEYDSCLDITSIKTAINKIKTGATAVTIDTTSNPGFIRIEITGGDFEQVHANDQITVLTGSNAIKGAIIQQKLNSQELLILDIPGVIDEVGTAVLEDDIFVWLRHDGTKDFHKRRWDKREFYYYA